MTKDELQLLGFTEEDVLNRLVDRLHEGMVETEECYAREFGSRVEKAIRARVDQVLASAVENHILPKVSEMVDGIVLQETNKWGEKVGKSLTFVEFLTQRTDAYIREEVNHNGKTKDEDSYSWSKHSTRIAYMIHQHLQYNIESAMKKALGDVNSSVRSGLEEAVKIAISKITVKVNTTVETR